MSKSAQNSFIALLFIGLILLSAAVGALVAGARVPGFSFLAGAVFILVVTLVLFLYVKNHSSG